MNKTTLLPAILLAAAVSFSAGCDRNDGPLERAGESIDNATGDLGNAIEDACEDVKEGLGADDKDC